jgi:hypothetical protein
VAVWRSRNELKRAVQAHKAASRIQFIAQEYDREVKWKAKSLKQMNEKDKQPMEGDIEM